MRVPNLFTLIVLFGAIPLTVVLFALMRARRAVVVSAIGAWLFLPPKVALSIPGLPDYTKFTAATVGILIATLIFESSRLLNFRFRWFDVPMILWSLCPILSSVYNELGLYDGLSAAFGQTTIWFLPYLVGRLYFVDVEDMRDLALGMVIGGLCLVPLCLFELRMSPVLLSMIYGFGTFGGMRYGGYRPHVFFASSLEAGLWMNAVTLVAWWLWRTGQFKRLGNFAGALIVATLLVIAIACKTTGATLLILAGMTALWISWRTKTKWAMWGLLCLAPTYYAIRISDVWSGTQAVELARALLNDERAQSLEFRLDNEDVLIAKAMQHPYFGWGGWDRNSVYNDMGRRITVTDGMWIIVLGVYGCLGLVLMATAMLLPAVLFLKRFPVEQWDDPSIAPAAVIAVIIDLYLLDGLFNAMHNELYVLAAGGLINLVPNRSRLWAKTTARSTNAQERLVVHYRSLGRSLKDQGRFTEAKTAWLHALDLLTKQTTIPPARSADRQHWSDCANDLAWLLVTAPDLAVRDPVAALSLAEKAAAAQPDCSTYWNTLGAVQYRIGDFNAAVTALNRAVTLSQGGSAFDHYFLAMAYTRLENQDHAQQCFAQATLWMEQHRPGHADLLRLCDEARAILVAGQETSSTAH
jgi:tetratricopeptide (TPR) repeat protein